MTTTDSAKLERVDSGVFGATLAAEQTQPIPSQTLVLVPLDYSRNPKVFVSHSSEELGGVHFTHDTHEAATTVVA
jgi:hypothetical protein